MELWHGHRRESTVTCGAVLALDYPGREPHHKNVPGRAAHADTIRPISAKLITMQSDRAACDGGRLERIAELKLRVEALRKELTEANRWRLNRTPEKSNQWWAATERPAIPVSAPSTSPASDGSQKLRALTLRVEALAKDLAIAKPAPRNATRDRQWWTGAGLPASSLTNSSGTGAGDCRERLSGITARLRAFPKERPERRPNRTKEPMRQSWRAATHDQKASESVALLVALAFSVIAMFWLLLVDGTNWERILNMSLGR